MKELPIGISEYKDLINGNFVYVDKTKYIYDMVKKPKGYYFLSRPRRFGKSLLVSVLEYLFKGEKELFVDTWIYDKWNWESFPVVRLDMNSVTTDEITNFRQSLSERIMEIANEYNINLESQHEADMLYELVIKLSKETN
ncbi:MAG: AAA family ATPase, partial [Fervidobacterium sp.]|nr:AAA family ATPase [Fervidobacterium sp.]